MAIHPFFTFPLFEQFPELICVFSTRQGGLSKKPYDSLNLGLTSGDDRGTVVKNRERFFSKVSVDPDAVAFAGQIHSANPVLVTGPGLYKNTDALIFNGSGTFLSIQTADCFPVFIYAPISHTVAVIHAGWRGVVSGIINHTLEVLRSRCGVDPRASFAVIGPGLQMECFEVRKDVYNRINRNFIKPHPSKLQRYLDLNSMICSILKTAGIPEQNIYSSKECTLCKDRLFFSYRRDGSKSGRMMGLIGLQK
jgi:YfiH family protein